MVNRDYAAFLRAIFGEKSILLDDDAMNSNPALAAAVEEKMFEIIDEVPALQYISINDFLLEGKSKEDFADYIREHADEIAANVQAKILRKLRHPKNSKAFREFLVYKDKNDIK